MDATELKQRQAPLKEQYRSDPKTAVVTLHAYGRLGTDTVACSVATGIALVEAGLHPKTGGDGTLACSGDLLLQALAACAGVTLRAVATARGLDVTGTVHAEGDLDFRGTLGLERDAPVGFSEVRLRFDLQTDASENDLAALISTTERYCVVLQTLTTPPSIVTTATTTTS